VGKQPADHHRTQEPAPGNDRMKNIEVIHELYKKTPGRLVRETIEMSVTVQAPTPRYLEVLRKNGLLDKYLNA
jgi:dihydroorotate dehydrogenase